jgi:hypothetical protein
MVYLKVSKIAIKCYKLNIFSPTGECGVHYPGGFLVGGEVALPGEFPYMALLV